MKGKVLEVQIQEFLRTNAQADADEDPAAEEEKAEKEEARCVNFCRLRRKTTPCHGCCWGNISHFCLLWFSGNPSLNCQNLDVCSPSNVNRVAATSANHSAWIKCPCFYVDFWCVLLLFSGFGGLQETEAGVFLLCQGL